LRIIATRRTAIPKVSITLTSCPATWSDPPELTDWRR
jgi:hypothetical protein